MNTIKYAVKRLWVPIGWHADKLWISYNLADAFEKEVIFMQIAQLSMKYYGMRIEKELPVTFAAITAEFIPSRAHKKFYPLPSFHICKLCSLQTSTVHKQFIAATTKHPEKGTLALYRKLHLSGRKGNEIKEQLLSLGLLKTEEVRNPNGWKKILRPTQKGLTLITG